MVAPQLLDPRYLSCRPISTAFIPVTLRDNRDCHFPHIQIYFSQWLCDGQAETSTCYPPMIRCLPLGTSATTVSQAHPSPPQSHLSSSTSSIFASTPAILSSGGHTWCNVSCKELSAFETAFILSQEIVFCIHQFRNGFGSRSSVDSGIVWGRGVGELVGFA